MKNRKLPRVLRFLVGVLALSAWFPFAGVAHESRPAYLELSEREAGVFDIMWRRPARGDRVLALYPKLPAHCIPVGHKGTYVLPGSTLERWTVDCGKTGLVGHSLYIDGLAATLTDVLVRVALVNGASHSQILRPNAPGFILKGAPSIWQVSGDYFLLGVEHILGGVDHLLFVLGLLLIVRGRWLLIKTVTAFTVAHSITHAVATLGFVHVPQAPVEAVIALSILFLATELAKKHDAREGLTERYPWIVAFSFGLLHGFGFAGALSGIGLPQTDIPLALLMFNVGVEAGQLLFIGLVIIILQIGKRIFEQPIAWVPQVAAYGIGGIAAFWVIQRVSGFF
jgi:hydrogenase/urease accessory protein HupE